MYKKINKIKLFKVIFKGIIFIKKGKCTLIKILKKVYL